MSLAAEPPNVDGDGDKEGDWNAVPSNYRDTSLWRAVNIGSI